MTFGGHALRSNTGIVLQGCLLRGHSWGHVLTSLPTSFTAIVIVQQAMAWFDVVLCRLLRCQ